MVDTFGTSDADEAIIEGAVREIFPLTPKGIIDHLQLRRPIFRQTSAYGHFGRTEPEFTWENTDQVESLKSAVQPAHAKA